MENKSRKWLRRGIGFTLFFLVTFIAVRGYYRLTDDFRISHMVYEMPHHEEWEVPPLSSSDQEFLDTILAQPFHYLGKGAQSYAFGSEDDKYVIKFFKFKHLKPSWITENIPEIGSLKDYKEKKIARKKRLINSVFSGYRLAYDVHRKESGILYLHLNRTKDLGKTVTLYDKIGREHKLDLDPIVFLVQEKVKSSREMLEEALIPNDLNLAKQRIDAIIDLYLLEYSKGIYDRDHGVLHNTGFVGDQVIHLDVGKLSKDNQMKQLANQKEDLLKVCAKFEVYIRRNFPEAYEPLMAHINQRLAQAFS